uniref:Wrch protein n=1 Tax=Phallusia mammillata TaxID=59560 RepID=A0A6F9DRP5_9ASCI|nr:Wrch protein [Phallusia mammillata]
MNPPLVDDGVLARTEGECGDLLDGYKTTENSGTALLNNNFTAMAPDASTRFSAECCEGAQVAEKPEVEQGEDKNDEVGDDSENRLKCVFLGDGAVGKTSLVVSYSTNGYPTEYIPTAFDNYSVRVTINEQPIRLQICDTAGQDEFDSMRPLCYPGTHVFMVCFSVVRPTSLCNIRDKWLPEIKRFLPKVPILLVGTQTDLRTNLDVLVDLARLNERPVGEEEAEKFAKQCGAIGYVECSALTQKNLKEVFDTAILEGLDFVAKQAKKGRKRSRLSIRRNESTKSEKRELAQRKAKSVRRKSVVWWRKYFCMS